MLLRDIASAESALFLKSEYGPLSDFWPAVAFSSPQVKKKIDRTYRAGLDFILYTGTTGSRTRSPEDRGKLLSLVRLDPMKLWRTEQLVPASSWQWAQEHYPRQWEYAFGVLEGWNIVERPRSSDLLPDSYAKMGRYPFRGSVVAIEPAEKQRVLDLRLEQVILPNRRPLTQSLTLDFLPRNDDLNRDANRIADLVFNRVTASGSWCPVWHP